jgi:Ni,Fe-hydrogenase III large subunit/Ni,Fe-hydrogenase III component G
MIVMGQQTALDLAGCTRLAERIRGEARFETTPDGLPDACAAVAAMPSARLATMVGEDARASAGGFRLTYTFALPPGGWASIETVVPASNPVYPSVTPRVPAAHWYEREVQDLLGVVAEGHPDPRRLVLHDDWPSSVHPLRKDFDPARPPAPVKGPRHQFHNLHGEGIVEIPVGPIHAGVIEPGHFRFAAVGERVLHLEVRLFYTHRGIEKLVEGKRVEQALQIAERVCGVCSLSHAVSFCQAIEQLAGIEIPMRAAYIRSIGLELERLYNHIGDLGNLCAGIGFSVGASAGARLKDELQRLNERLTGNRFLRGLCRIGGVRRDLDASQRQEIEVALGSVATEFGAMIELIWSAENVVERFRGTGILPTETARALGAVGVAARARGIGLDSRRDHPHAAYSNLPEPVPVPVRTESDVEGRALVRMDEVLVSLGLLAVLVDSLPSGALAAPFDAIPGDTVGFAVTESPRGENLHWVRTAPDGTIDRYRVRSASYPNWPAVAASVPGNMVPDFPVINKSFELCYACNDR